MAMHVPKVTKQSVGSIHGNNKRHRLESMLRDQTAIEKRCRKLLTGQILASCDQYADAATSIILIAIR